MVLQLIQIQGHACIELFTYECSNTLSVDRFFSHSIQCMFTEMAVCVDQLYLCFLPFNCMYFQSTLCLFPCFSFPPYPCLILYLYKTIITVTFLFIFHWISENCIFDKLYFTCLPMHIGFCRMPFQLYLYASGIWQRICSV